MMTRQIFVPVMEFECPFCGGKFGIIEDQYALFHYAPPCQKFIDLDVTDFLHAVNTAYGFYSGGSNVVS